MELLFEPVDPQIPLVAPRTPLVVKSGGVEVLRLSTMLSAADVERPASAHYG